MSERECLSYMMRYIKKDLMTLYEVEQRTAA